MLIDSGTPTGPLVSVDIPPDFHQVPLAAQVETRTAEQLSVVADLHLPDAAQREAVSLYLEALAIRLGKGDVGGAAFCAVRLGGRPSTATLTLAMHPVHTTDGGLAMLGAAEALRRDGRWSEVQLFTLGSRAAVSAVAEQLLADDDVSTQAPVGADHRPVLAGEPALPAGRPAAVAVREMAVVQAVPGHEFVVVVTVSTPSLGDWDAYRALLVDMCLSMRVEPRPT